MRHQHQQQGLALLAGVYAEVRAAALQRQRELFDAIRSGPFADAGEPLPELEALRSTVAVCAQAAGLRDVVRGEPVALLELHELVLGGGSVLDPPAEPDPSGAERWLLRRRPGGVQAEPEGRLYSAAAGPAGDRAAPGR